MTLTADQLAAYRRAGHVTVPGVFTTAEMDAAIAEAEAWGREFLAGLAPEQRQWYVDHGVAGRVALRKLDHPVCHRPFFRRLAADRRLTAMVEQIIGSSLRVPFSQIFFKPPEGGGPKPVHQDNYYFGPSDPEALVTAWIALDAATAENGCLFFGDGTHRGPVYPHEAPAGEPFNLLVPEAEARKHPMTPAPVPKGGVSFHHGNVLHQSGPNRSTVWRRACAIHYVARDTVFASPALTYDPATIIAIA